MEYYSLPEFMSKLVSCFCAEYERVFCKTRDIHIIYICFNGEEVENSTRNTIL